MVVNFRVLDESPDWLVVDKPAPLIVHPANNKPEPTLLGGLQRLCSYEIENGATLAIINRLDRETSGLVLVAKNKKTARDLSMLFEHRKVQKQYLAIVTGWPEEDHWVCDAPILRAGELGFSSIWVRQIVDQNGKQCRTKFSVEHRFLRKNKPYSLIRCFPETGRMHQIRVHLAHQGFPIAGDKLYSGDGCEYLEWVDRGWNDGLARKLVLPRHALHACHLSLSIDDSEWVWNSPLSSDLLSFIDGGPVYFDDNVMDWSR